jgi:hypothetical protein
VHVFLAPDALRVLAGGGVVADAGGPPLAALTGVGEDALRAS